jgi:D-alanyl-lipoteichoic acid acyltransferase DltB (MBOAT superfamily)
MLFSSIEFILIFLPICWFIYFGLNIFRLTKVALLWLVLASLFFYGFDEPVYLLLILGSSVFNFIFGINLSRNSRDSTAIERKLTLTVAIALNLLLLGYFKYADFFVENVNYVFGTSWPLNHVTLPLGISFFTFQQIAFLVDSYRHETAEYSFVHYLLFVTFFPQLIAGPIVHHKEILPQLNSNWQKLVRYNNLQRGLYIFGIGLFKKLILADTLAIWATDGFDFSHKLDFVSAWVTSLSYTFQLYFDFSGYCDMAIGLGLLFNVNIPLNFNSPYKASDIQDFWRRWHITLSRFLRDYLYIPLGGSRLSFSRTLLNLFLTFLLGGLWHGASWMFVLWGALHGVAVVGHRVWQQLGLVMHRRVSWALTFLFVNFAWIFFRAKSLEDAERIISGMVDFGSISIPYREVLTQKLAWGGVFFENYFFFLPVSVQANILPIIFLVLAVFILRSRNSLELAQGETNWGMVIKTVCLLVVGIAATLVHRSQVFLYFNF